MRYQSQKHTVIPDIDVWVVPSSLRDCGNVVYKLHCSDEVFEAPFSYKLASL